MHSSLDENEPLILCSTSFDLDLVVDMVISSIGFLELDLPTPIATLDMYSFQSVVPSKEYLLESMIEVCTWMCIPSRALSSWKP
jgi:hypothetical protein